MSRRISRSFCRTFFRMDNRPILTSRGLRPLPALDFGLALKRPLRFRQPREFPFPGFPKPVGTPNWFLQEAPTTAGALPAWPPDFSRSLCLRCKVGLRVIILDALGRDQTEVTRGHPEKGEACEVRLQVEILSRVRRPWSSASDANFTK
jgi:hypothetical protein